MSSTSCLCGCGQETKAGKNGRANDYVHGHNRRGAGSPSGWIEQGMHFVWVDGKKRPLHRLIVEELLGRPLGPEEVVCHRDGDLLNNDPDNLFVVSRREHFERSMDVHAKEPWMEDEKDDAVRLYCTGMTIDEVARALGRSYSATRRLLARWGVLRTPATTRFLRAHRHKGGDPPDQPYDRCDSNGLPNNAAGCRNRIAWHSIEDTDRSGSAKRIVEIRAPRPESSM
jgi:hypothetical protein